MIAAEQSTKAAETEGDSLVYHLYHKDIQGSTTSILDESGAGEISYEYEDFGETEVHGSETFKNEICYTGGIYDATTGHYYLNARYYDPETGRFLTEDTYRGELEEPDTLHLYVYCKNNPINYVDPSGHDAIVLRSNFLSKYIGHMAVLIKHGSNWYYFSWDTNAHKEKNMGKKANTKKNKSVKDKKVYSYINKRFGRKSENKKYKKYIYIKGNFEKSYKYIKKIKKGKTKYKKYDLLKENCAWMAIEVLRKGEIGKKKMRN